LKRKALCLLKKIFVGSLLLFSISAALYILNFEWVKELFNEGDWILIYLLFVIPTMVFSLAKNTKWKARADLYSFVSGILVISLYHFINWIFHH
jgi:uncharacterized membrane protein YcjF (UPF0283 family)